MKEKKRVYEALVDGAMEGLTDDALYEFVRRRCPKATSKKIVRASLLALADPHLMDRNILDVIYALAIKHRLDEGVMDEEEEADVAASPPQAADRSLSPPG
jgi:hypothetical protein